MNLRWHYLIALTLPTFLTFGCASSNSNPHKSETTTGYVDFYTDTNVGLAWEIRQAPAGAGDFEAVFSDVTPVPGNILRLRFSPGQHWLRVTLVNRVVSKPADINVTVESGKVTPVRVVLAEAGSTVVVSTRTLMGGTRTRSGRQTNTKRDESTMYELSSTAGSPVPFRPEQQMPYAR